MRLLMKFHYKKKLFNKHEKITIKFTQVNCCKTDEYAILKTVPKNIWNYIYAKSKQFTHSPISAIIPLSIGK